MCQNNTSFRAVGKTAPVLLVHLRKFGENRNRFCKGCFGHKWVVVTDALQPQVKLCNFGRLATVGNG